MRLRDGERQCREGEVQRGVQDGLVRVSYLLDDWQHPGLCVLVSVSTDSLNNKKAVG
jgi:hypothetical protein